MYQTKKPLDTDKIVEEAVKRIVRFAGGVNATYPVPIAVVGGKGPNGLVAKLAHALNRAMHIPDIRNIHTADEMCRHLEEDSMPDPMIVHCGEALPSHAQNLIETFYTRHRNVAPRLCIIVVGVHTDELVKLGRWSPAFCALFGARIIDFETVVATERRKNIDRFTARLERCANIVRAPMEVEPDVVTYLKEVLEQRPSTSAESVIQIADQTWRRAYRPEGTGPTRVTREHLRSAFPHGFDQAVMAQPGHMVH